MRKMIAALILLTLAVSAHAGTAKNCAMSAEDRSWIDGALRAWELVREERLRLRAGYRAPIIVFDAECRFVSSSEPEWAGEPHDGTIRLPDGRSVPAGVTSFASGEKGKPPFFVMALPSIWRAANITGPLGFETGLTAVFIHEYMHAAQAGSLASAFEKLESLGAPEDISDDSLQAKFASDPEYVAAWERERDLFYAAATERDATEARGLAADAYAAMKARQARWLKGDDALWKVADDLFLTMEGTGQWSAFAWLVHPEGAALAPEAAREGMRGRRRWWSQDEGLALFLVIDRFLPGWQKKAFGPHPKLAIDLLAEIVEPR